MATFNITGDSSCCAIGTRKLRITYKFAKGSILFSCKKAQKGVMEILAIKDVQLINNESTYNQWIALYVDSLNGLWNEDELCTETDAKQLALDYLIAQQEALTQALQQCQCKI